MVGILFQLSYHLGDVEKTLAGRLAVSNTTIEHNAGVEAPLPSTQSIPVPLVGAAAHSRIQVTSGSTPCMLRDSFLICLLFPVTRQLLNLTKLSKLALSCHGMSCSDSRRFSPLLHNLNQPRLLHPRRLRRHPVRLHNRRRPQPQPLVKTPQQSVAPKGAVFALL